MMQVGTRSVGFLVMPIVRWISLCRNRFRAVDLFGRSDGFVSESVIAMHNSRLRLLSFGAFALFSHVCATTAVVSSSQPGEEQHMADPTPIESRPAVCYAWSMTRPLEVWS